jgi:hypothetical protein
MSPASPPMCRWRDVVPLKLVAVLVAVLLAAGVGYGELAYRRGHKAGSDAARVDLAALEAARAANIAAEREAADRRTRDALAALEVTREAARRLERDLRARLAAVAVADPAPAACVLDAERLRIATDAVHAANAGHPAGRGHAQSLPAAGRSGGADAR